MKQPEGATLTHSHRDTHTHTHTPCNGLSMRVGVEEGETISIDFQIQRAKCTVSPSSFFFFKSISQARSGKVDVLIFSEKTKAKRRRGSYHLLQQFLDRGAHYDDIRTRTNLSLKLKHLAPCVHCFNPALQQRSCLGMLFKTRIIPSERSFPNCMVSGETIVVKQPCHAAKERKKATSLTTTTRTPVSRYISGERDYEVEKHLRHGSGLERLL